MQPVEEFMAEFFRARTASLEEDLKRNTPLRQKFFAIDCLFDSGDGGVERSRSEQVINSSTADNFATVVTDRGFGEMSQSKKLRYSLKAEESNWLIKEVEFECSGCQLMPDGMNCIVCGGTGWIKMSIKPKPKPEPEKPWGWNEPPPLPGRRFEP